MLRTDFGTQMQLQLAVTSCLQVLGPREKGRRSAAERGAWQLISPVDARGRVLLVDGLHEIQDEVCSVLHHKPTATYTCARSMPANML